MDFEMKAGALARDPNQGNCKESALCKASNPKHLNIPTLFLTQRREDAKKASDGCLEFFGSLSSLEILEILSKQWHHSLCVFAPLRLCVESHVLQMV